MPTALVTGASSGIGLELATLLAKNRHDVVLVARGRDRLESVAQGLTEEFGVAATVLPADLTDPAAPLDIFLTLAERKAVIDVLVNDAGFGVYGFFADTSLEKELAMIQVNVAAPTQLTKLFLPGMLERRRGRILNVASTAAFQPGPLMAVYYATKAYVLSFSEALGNETRRHRRHGDGALPRSDGHGLSQTRAVQGGTLASRPARHGRRGRRPRRLRGHDARQARRRPGSREPRVRPGAARDTPQSRHRDLPENPGVESLSRRRRP